MYDMILSNSADSINQSLLFDNCDSKEDIILFNLETLPSDDLNDDNSLFTSDFQLFTLDIADSIFDKLVITLLLLSFISSILDL